MVKGEEEAARKLALLEGDRKAFLESSQSTAKQNAQKITELRKENKALLAKLKSLKAVHLLDLKVAELIKKHNAFKHQSTVKTKKIDEVEQQIKRLEAEEGPAKPPPGLGDEQTLRELENRLDKAVIKTQEAQFIGKTYKQITDKLQQDRLTFDGRITALEQAIANRKAEISRLEAMLSDASTSRDSARAELAKAEQEAQTARAAREQEKKRLQAQAEERRRQYEAMEKRLRLASVSEESSSTDQPLPQDLTLRLAAYEKAFGRLQDVTGVTTPEDVLARFAAQGQTKEHLEKLLAQDTELHKKLKADYDDAVKRLEQLQYSGEQNAATSKAELAEYESRAAKAQETLATAKAEAEATQKQVARVAAGIDHLCDKLGSEGKVAKTAALAERLAVAGAELKELVKALGARQDELAAMHDEDLPAHNVRVPLASGPNFDDLSDSGDEDEHASRLAMKRQAASLVEAKTAKPKKKKGKHGEEDD